jgi:ketosteroid isomerase-like protein
MSEPAEISHESENARKVRRLVEAWNLGDWSVGEALSSPDLVVFPPRGWPEGAEFEGWEAAERQYERLKEAWTQEGLEIERLEERGDTVLLQVRWTGKGEASGLDLDLHVWVLYQFRDGLNTRVEFFLDEGEARQAFAG